MPTVRRPAVAGTFYPATAPELRRAIEEAFAHARPVPENAPAPKALVVPHAGYVYSGAVAASAYAWIARSQPPVRRVVLLGPCHRMYVRAIAVPSADAFETPLGLVAVDATLRASALDVPGVVLDDRPFSGEHCLEVQLPFLQTVLDGDAAVLPVLVGDVAPGAVASLIDALWGGPDTLVVVSTDLSHYHRYEVAERLDSGTAAVIVAMQPDAIEDADACGARPLQGLLEVAARRRLGVAQLDLRNSGDTGGDRERVVGYGAFAVA